MVFGADSSSRAQAHFWLAGCSCVPRDVPLAFLGLRTGWVFKVQRWWLFGRWGCCSCGSCPDSKKINGRERENESAAGLWIGNDLWVNWTSWDAVNRQLTFLLANLHLSGLKCWRKETKGKHLLNEVRDNEDPCAPRLRDQPSQQQQEVLFMEACKCTCSANPVEDIKVENKAGLHILIWTERWWVFPRITLHLTQGAPVEDLAVLLSVPYFKDWLTEHLNFCKFRCPLAARMNRKGFLTARTR